MTKVLTVFLASFAAGIGFLAGLLLLGLASYFGLEKSQEWSLESGATEVVSYPQDVGFESHSAVNLKRKFSIAGELRVESHEKYSRIDLKALLFDGERFLLECNESKYMKDAHNYFEVNCDVENSKLPESIRYDLEVYRALVAD